MTEEYECHITLQGNPENYPAWERVAEAYRWKTSFIVGDPLLGKAGFFYFTCHDSQYDRIFDKMNNTVRLMEPFVIRMKIEKVVYDTKRITRVHSEPEPLNIPK